MNITHIGLSGIMASQHGLNMSARNTANLLTPGYTRQSVLLGARAGGGVEVAQLLRHGDAYKSRQLWLTQGQAGRYSAAEPYYVQLEKVMGLDAGSVKGGIDAFFASLDEVSSDPTSVPLRQQVIAAADGLAKRFDALRQTLYGQRDAATQQSQTIGAQVGELTATIARLNARIGEAQATGGAASELLDQRERAIGELAGLVDVRVTETGNGMLDVALADGQPLVAGKLAGRLDVVVAAGGSVSVELRLGNASFPLDGSRLGGALGGLRSYSEQTLQGQIDHAAQLAGELAGRVNAALTAGFGTDGLAGDPLFSFDATTGKLALNPAITQQRLGFSASATEPGNSDQLSAAIDVRMQRFTLPGLGDVSVGDAYTMMVGKLGSDSQDNKAALATASTLREQAQLSLQSVAGVNSEEEVVKVSELMQAYQANMKVISVANELFDTTLNAL